MAIKSILLDTNAYTAFKLLQRDRNIPIKLAGVVDLALTEKPQIYFQSAAKFKKALIDIQF